jgi:hypothetical protein
LQLSLDERKKGILQLERQSVKVVEGGEGKG